MVPEPLKEEAEVRAAPGLGVPDFLPPEEPEPEPEPRPATPPPLPPRPRQRALTPPPLPPRPHAQARVRAREDSPPPRPMDVPQDLEWVDELRRARRDEQRARRRGEPRRGGQNFDRPNDQLEEREIRFLQQFVFLQQIGVPQRQEHFDMVDMILNGEPLPNEAFDNLIGDLDMQDVPIGDMGIFDDYDIFNEDWN
ncbi:unnamed protein product [Caenorhabditis nigoni]